MPGEAQLLGQDVGGAGGQEGQGYLASGQTVNDFVQGAVATAGDYQLAAVLNCFSREIGGASGGFARTVGKNKLSLDAIAREDGAGALDLLQAGGFAAARSGIEDQERVLDLCRARRRIGLTWLVRGGGSGERVKATRIV